MYRAAVSVQRFFQAVHSFMDVGFGTGPALMGPVLHTALTTCTKKKNQSNYKHCTSAIALLYYCSQLFFKQRH